jgi:hypothetical protein
MTRRGGDGKFETVPATLPLLFRKPRTKRSIAVAKGNHTRRINEMRRARILMENAPDYPGRPA